MFARLRESGVYAFFTRSPAANIPVNMALREKAESGQDTYSVSIPLGATINMAGAAITITVPDVGGSSYVRRPGDSPTKKLLLSGGLAVCFLRCLPAWQAVHCC